MGFNVDEVKYRWGSVMVGFSLGSLKQRQGLEGGV